MDSTESDMDVILQRRLRAYELALDTARRDAVAAAQTLSKLTARIGELELSLSDAREHPQRLEAQLSESKRARRAAEQRAYAERVQREELQQQFAELEHGREQAAETMEGLLAAEARQEELEDEVATLRRRVDEADHLAAAAVSARERAERQIIDLSAELDALRVADPAVTPAPESEDLSVRRLRAVLRALRPELSTLAAMLERERSARVAAEARVSELDEELQTHMERANRAFVMLEQVRGKLPPGVARAEPSLSPAEPLPASLVAAAPAPDGPIDPDRLAEALTRLRAVTGAALDGHPEPGTSEALDRAPDRHGPDELDDGVEALLAQESESGADDLPPPPARIEFTGADPDIEVEPAEGVRPWLRTSFHRLARYDPDASGRLLLALLPLQVMAYRDPIVYDIGCEDAYVHVTVGRDQQRIERSDHPRPTGDVDFSVQADASALTSLMTAGRLRRRLGFWLPKVKGDRQRLAALDAVLSVPLFVGELSDAGVELDPALALKLVGAMIGRDAANGDSFTIGFRSPQSDPAGPAEVALVIDAGAQPEVKRDVTDPTMTIVCAPQQLLGALSDMPGTSFALIGARDPLSWVQQRLKAAQSV